MKITYYGQSCFGVGTGETQLLFDPFISPNPLAGAIDVNAVPADYLLISHAHQDHIADAVSIAKRTGATVIANFEVVTWLAGQGVGRGHPLNHGGAHRFDFGRVKFVAAVHSSSFADGSYGGNPGGFLVETAECDFYYSGDTALTLDMKLIGESASLSWAALCIGDNFTMGIDDAVKAADFLQCNRILGVHYDTFPPIKIDHDQARKKFQDAGKELMLLPIGGSVAL
jgi:L-ascorbate metabolism protein UlaG (beta-lactamase superfamily)